MVYGSGKFTYELVEDWAQLPKGWGIEAAGVAVDREDNVYVFSRTDHPVMVFNREGKLVNSWGEGYFKRPHEVVIGPDGAVWLDDEASHTVTKYDIKGNELMVLGTRGKPSDTGYIWTGEHQFFECLETIKRGAPPFNRPCGVDLNSKGEIFVADGYGNARVHKFSPDGKLLLSWGEPGRGPGEFRSVHGVCVDEPRGRLLVCDRENNRIQIFDFDGNYIAEWNDVHRPTKAVMDKEGNIYVSELAWRPNTPVIPGAMARISIFNSEGQLQARWGTPDTELHDLENALFLAPHTIAVDSNGDIYEGEVRESRLRGNKVVRKFARIK